MHPVDKTTFFHFSVDKCHTAFYNSVTDVNQRSDRMEKQQLSQSEWQIMQLLWAKPHTLMELVAELSASVGWSKSTVATMVRRMEAKGLIGYETEDRAKRFHPLLQQEEAAIRETHSLLSRAYRGSIGLLVSSLAHAGQLSRDDIDELYAILKEAEGDAT
jgi:predicted transcriptional regulator